MPKTGPKGSAVEAPDALAQAIDRAAVDKERVFLTRKGKAVAALVPIEDVAALEELEDRVDVEEGEKRLEAWEAEGRPIVTIEEIARKYGVKL